MPLESSVTFRCLDEEKTLIEMRAKEMNTSTSEYCRMILTGPVLHISPSMPSTPVVLNPPPPPKIPTKFPQPYTAGPRGLPGELLEELKFVLQKYYVD